MKYPDSISLLSGNIMLMCTAIVYVIQIEIESVF